jgi:hypothetical protein
MTMPAMARIFAANFSHRRLRNLWWLLVAPNNDRCGITNLSDAHHLVDSPGRFGLNNRRTMHQFSAQARLKRE